MGALNWLLGSGKPFMTAPKTSVDYHNLYIIWKKYIFKVKKMGNPPNNIFKPKGQKAKVLVCLIRGERTGKAIIKEVIQGGNFLHRYIKELKNRGYIKEEKSEFMDSKGRPNFRIVLSLNHKFFLDYCKVEMGLSFNKYEQMWIKKNYYREIDSIETSSMFYFEGRVIDAIISCFIERILEEKDFLKKEKLRKMSLKFLPIAFNQKYSPRLYSALFGLHNILSNYYANEYVIGEILEKYIKSDYSDLSWRNKKADEFFNRLIDRKDKHPIRRKNDEKGFKKRLLKQMKKNYEERVRVAKEQGNKTKYPSFKETFKILSGNTGKKPKRPKSFKKIRNSPSIHNKKAK